MTVQKLIAQKQALNQSLKEIDTQIAELLPKGNVTVMKWLQWAKEQGFDWAQSAIDQCRMDYEREKVISLKSAVWVFNSWDGTKEGFKYWDKIDKELCV